MPDCRICQQKQQGEPPLGGYIYEDEQWYVYHAPASRSVPGQLFVVPQRHLLDPGDMQPDEAASYGPILGKVTRAVKQVLGAERVYTLAVVEATPHLHVWVIPRTADSPEKGTAWLNRVIGGKETTDEAEVRRVAEKLSAALA